MNVVKVVDAEPGWMIASGHNLGMLGRSACLVVAVEDGRAYVLVDGTLKTIGLGSKSHFVVITDCSTQACVPVCA